MLPHALIAAAQEGDEAALGQVYEALRPRLRGLAVRYAATPDEREELEQEAAESLLKNLPTYKVGSRASLFTFLYKRVETDVRNASLARRAAGALDGDSYAEFWRVSGKVREGIEHERNQGGDPVGDGEVYSRIKGGLMSLPGKHAWSEGRVVSAHELLSRQPLALDGEADRDGEETSLPDGEVHGGATGGRETETLGRKRALVQELMTHLSDRQRQLVEMMFGLGGSRPATPAEIAEELRIPVKSVSRRWAEIKKKMASLVAEREYPATPATATTDKGRRLLEAVAENDEGVYVRVLPGRGKKDVQVKYLNDEGDMAVVYGSLDRLVALGVLEGDRVERTIPASPEAGYAFHRLYGWGTAPTEHPVSDQDRTDMTGCTVADIFPEGQTFELGERQGEPVLPTDGFDYGIPLWSYAPADRAHVMGRRDYLRKHR
ncbi:RNA polymerase sigma factor [Streptomyces sp. 6N106]|uniref:RNA polymerase sigma factor n=1 Tax=Streptomyces sp. 6N106 TaxID=3457418 RepID=UPI003FD53F5B